MLLHKLIAKKNKSEQLLLFDEIDLPHNTIGKCETMLLSDKKLVGTLLGNAPPLFVTLLRLAREMDQNPWPEATPPKPKKTRQQQPYADRLAEAALR